MTLMRNPQPVENCPIAVLGEGPCWHELERKLYWVDILGPCLHRYDPASNAHDSWEMPERIGTVAPASEGRMLVALEKGLAFFHPDTNQLDRLPDIDPRGNTRFNDGKCDPPGPVLGRHDGSR